MATGEITVKLLVNKATNKVLFAEAGKDFVDFIFSLLALPVGTMVKVLKKEGMVGSLGRLHGGLEALSASYLRPDLDKNVLLDPAVPAPNTLLLAPAPASAPNATSLYQYYYRCSNCNGDPRYVSDCVGIFCPHCRYEMTQRLELLPSQRQKEAAGGGIGAGGFVKSVITYMVMDDLEVSPMSTISSIALLNKFQVREVGALEERVVTVGMDEAVAILKASLRSTTVLSDVFLAK